MSGAVLIPSHTPDEGQVLIGQAFTGYLDRVAPPSAREKLSRDAVEILQRGSVRTERSQQTGLVVGRVQAGKTLSYEGVACLARDNGFSLVVVISGISNPLLDQGVRRLRRDLTSADENGWTFFVNPGSDAQDASRLESIRANWADESTPRALKKTAVCLLLKHHGRIDTFRAIVNDMDWAGLKVLIVDDEADQASLNTSFRRGRESATYRNIRALRNCFPSHAYLQYTATPQAPLLLAISDVLSPDFVQVIEPGPEYVGGSDFFGSASNLVHVIPDSDLERAEHAGGPPPETLVRAFREFLVGATDVLARGRAETRSMLVHPSRLTEPHATFFNWVQALVSFWKGAIEEAEEAPDLRCEFAAAWDSVHATDPSLSDFELCWSMLKFVLRNLQLVEMNARESRTPVIEWDSTKTYVLVGGQALDRGFTVDGLSVTYMSRDPGTWTADTIQQRARFFGYKRSFLGQCRIYLEPDLRDAFEMYVEHERHMLRSLREIADGTTSLKEWERQFLLNPAMKATRQTVVSLPTITVAPGERWVYEPRLDLIQSDHDDSLALVDAMAAFGSQVDSHGHRWGSMSGADLLTLLESAPVLVGVETPDFRAMRLQLARLLDEVPTMHVTTIRMRDGSPSFRTQTQSASIQPFQGASSAYLGDRQIYDPDRITVQVHWNHVRAQPNDDPYLRALTLAVRVPDNLADGWLLEDSA